MDLLFYSIAFSSLWYEHPCHPCCVNTNLFITQWLQAGCLSFHSLYALILSNDICDGYASRHCMGKCPSSLAYVTLYSCYYEHILDVVFSAIHALMQAMHYVGIQDTLLTHAFDAISLLFFFSTINVLIWAVHCMNIPDVHLDLYIWHYISITFFFLHSYINASHVL